MGILVSGTNTFSRIANETITAGRIVCIVDGKIDHSAGISCGVAIIGGAAGDPINVAGPGCVVNVSVDATGVTAADAVKSDANGLADVAATDGSEAVNVAGKMFDTVAGSGVGEMLVV